MTKHRILYLSSWPIFDALHKNVKIPFIYEQVGLLSSHVEAIYLELQFESIYHWIKRYLNRQFIIAQPVPVEKGNWASSFRVFLPKISTRITRNTLWQDYYLAGALLGKTIYEKIGGFDLTHIHTILPLGAFGLGLKKSTGINYIIQEHSGPFSMHLSSRIQQRGVNKIAHNALEVLPVSKSLLETMRTLCHNQARYCVAPNWVRTDIFRPAKSTNDPTDVIKIVTVSSRQKVKRLWLMFNVVDALERANYPVTLDIYGISDYEDVDHLSQDGISDLINFKGYFSREKLGQVFKNYDVYLCTSEVETFGLAPAEAICSGIPVVSTDCGGVREYIDEDNGVIVPSSINEICDAIIKIKGKRLGIEQWEKISKAYGKEAFLKFFLTKYEEYKKNSR